MFLVTIRTLGLFETKLVGHPARDLYMFEKILVFVAAHVHLIKSPLNAERKDTTRLILNNLSHFGICGQCRRHAQMLLDLVLLGLLQKRFAFTRPHELWPSFWAHQRKSRWLNQIAGLLIRRFHIGRLLEHLNIR